MALIRWVAAGDNHGDMVDKEAVEKLLSFCEEWKPKFRVHLGDGMDLRAFRIGAGGEEKREGITRDVQAHLLFLDQYKPDVFLEGNHDHRLRELAEHGSEEALATEHARMLQDKLDDDYRKRKLTVVRYGQFHDWWQHPDGGHKFAHGKHHCINVAKKHSEVYEGPVITGHVHRKDYYQGPSGVSLAVPCLARIWDLRYDSHRSAKKAHRNGWAYGLLDSKTGHSEAWIVSREHGKWLSPLGEL